MRVTSRIIAGLVLAAVAAFAFAVDVPYMTGRVFDNAEILSPAARGGIEQKIRTHEQKTTNQIAVLTVPSLQGESVEQFATEVFEAWKLGQKGKDNGVLVLVSPAERKRVGWFLYLFLIPFWAMFPIVILGTRGAFILLCCYLVGFPVAKPIVKRRPWYEDASRQFKSKGTATIGGFTITSGGSSGFSSGGSSYRWFLR